MKNILLTSAILLLLFSGKLYAENDNSAGIKISKSVMIVSSDINYTDDNMKDRKGELISSSLGFGANLVYKIKSHSYLDISLAYTTYSFNDINLFKDNGKLEASSIDLNVNWCYYLATFDAFTPYVGAGGGFIFMNSNEDELTPIRENIDLYFDDDSGKYLSDLSLFLNAKIGLHIPVNEKFVVTTEFEFSAIIARNYGVIPKLSIGGSYRFN